MFGSDTVGLRDLRTYYKEGRIKALDWWGEGETLYARATSLDGTVKTWKSVCLTSSMNKKESENPTMERTISRSRPQW